MLALILLALFAGALTTVAGMGGGLILMLGLSLFLDPLVALTITGPALLVGNLHRVGLYREHIEWRLAWRFALGALPMAILGGVVATGLPAGVIRGLVLVLALLATAKVLFGWAWKPPANALLPGGAVAGFVTATSGGGGLIAGPLLLASDLSGRRYVATGAVGAATMHVGRLLGYGAGGGLETQWLLWGGVAALCIAVGNLVGDRLRQVIPQAAVPRLEVGVVVLCVLLATTGLA